MRKTFKWILLSIIVIAVIFSLIGATCTINPGPVPTGPYWFTFTNNTANTVQVWLDGILQVNLAGGGNSWTQLLAVGKRINLNYWLGVNILFPATPGNAGGLNYFINNTDGNITFTLGGGGWTVSER